MANHAIGDRVAELRRRRGMTQEELAEAAGLHPNIISKVERGGSARMGTYNAIARALGVMTMTFVAPSTVPTPPVEPSDQRDMLLSGLRDAIAPPAGFRGPVYRDTVDEGRPDLDRLGRAVRMLSIAYHDDRYDDVAQLAPGLIRSAHYHVAAVPQPQHDRAVRIRGDVLGLAGRYLIQIRAHDLALIAFRDAIRDAAEVGDQVLATMMMTGQAWAMLRQARFATVEQFCASIADEIEPRLSTAADDELGAWGRMLTRAAAAAARNNRPEEAREYLSVAAGAAARLGTERDDLTGHWGFGPMTVTAITTETELIAGHPDAALAHPIPRDAGVEATTLQRHLLDRAHALVLTGQLDQATEVLSDLRRQAPDWLRHQRLARDVVRDLLRAKKRTLSDEQRGLADWLNLEA